MAASVTIPVNAATLEQHEVLDNAAHEVIAQTEDEDYQWLTERLDALTAGLASLQSSSMERFAAMQELLSLNQSQSRTLIEAQGQMIQTLLQSVTDLSSNALQSSTLATLQQAETPSVTEVVTESAPVDADQTQVSSAQERAEKKRRRI